MSDTRCAVRRSGDGEPLTGLGILDGVTLLDLGQRHLLCCIVPNSLPSRIVAVVGYVPAITLRILPPTAPVNHGFTGRFRLPPMVRVYVEMKARDVAA